MAFFFGSSPKPTTDIEGETDLIKKSVLGVRLTPEKMDSTFDSPIKKHKNLLHPLMKEKDLEIVVVEKNILSPTTERLFERLRDEKKLDKDIDKKISKLTDEMEKDCRMGADPEREVEYYQKKLEDSLNGSLSGVNKDEEKLLRTSHKQALGLHGEKINVMKKMVEMIAGVSPVLLKFSTEPLFWLSSTTPHSMAYLNRCLKFEKFGANELAHK